MQRIGVFWEWGFRAALRLNFERMGLNYRSRKKVGKNSWVNMSKSGASLSTKVGPVTFNSRGGVYVNLPGGMHYRGRWK